MTPRTARPRRAAFTLVELLVVVTIIALLAGLLLVGIQRVAKVGYTATAANDISQLNVACETFKNPGTGFGFFPPSAFRLPTNSPTTTTNAQEIALETASFELLKQMYPRWNPVVNGSGVIQWGDLQPFAGQTLDGNQSMVLFLGGPQQTGWATDGPRAPTGTATKGPFFDFKQDRLEGAAGGPRHYLDPFKNPTNPGGKAYAYFGSTTGGKYPAINCLGVAPFVETATNPPAVTSGVVVKYLNQGSVQIVSAGEDGVFGPGCPKVGNIQCYYSAGQSNPAIGISPYGEGDQGADDMANFNNGNKLGTGK